MFLWFNNQIDNLSASIQLAQTSRDLTKVDMSIWLTIKMHDIYDVWLVSETACMTLVHVWDTYVPFQVLLSFYKIFLLSKHDINKIGMSLDTREKKSAHKPH